MKAETLKKAILQYAMQGKLVEQDPNDEPAKLLLERIKAEKEQLIKDGKIKKEKPLPPITEDEMPYELPKGWEWVRFSECIDVRDGTHDSPKYQTTGYPFVTSKNLNNGKLDFSNIQYISEEDFKKFSERSYVDNEDILFAMIGSIGNPVIVKKDREFSIKNVALFKKSNFILVKYLYYYLMYIQEILKSNASGAVQSFVSLSILRSYLFALPPLAEQQRIVERLEQILPLVEEYGKSEEKLSKLNSTLPNKIKQSILQHAVQGKLVPQNPNDEPASVLLSRIKAEKEQLIKDGKIKKEKPLPPITEDEIPYELPKGWEWVNLDTITAQIHYGYTASAENCGNAKLLRITDIQNNRVLWENVPFCSISDDNLIKYKLQNRDILIARTGGTIGKTYIVNDLSEIAVFASYLIRAIPLNNVNEKYIKIFMESPLYWEQLKGYSMGTGQPNVNGQSLSKLLIPLPSLVEQHRIVTKVEELLAIVDKIH
mgnify:CR=1 FL=1